MKRSITAHTGLYEAAIKRYRLIRQYVEVPEALERMREAGIRGTDLYLVHVATELLTTEGE